MRLLEREAWTLRKSARNCSKNKPDKDVHLPDAWLGHLCWSLRKSGIYYSLYRYCCRLNRKYREIWSGPSMNGTNITEQPDESISCVDETCQQLQVARACHERTDAERKNWLELQKAKFRCKTEHHQHRAFDYFLHASTFKRKLARPILRNSMKWQPPPSRLP